MTGPRYANPGAFRRALDDRLKAAAKAAGLPFNTLRRQFILECYLARVFALPDSQWILKGGTSLVVRIPGARHSRDLDLCTAVSDQELHASLSELRTAGQPSSRDPFVFDIIQRSELTGNAEGLQLTVNARLGVTTYEKFPIDMTTRLDFVGGIEIKQRPLPVQIDDVDEPPPMRLYPLCDQIADKVAAMYETHNGNPSGRYRDLVDLVIMTTHQGIVIDDVADALRVQEVVRRIILPVEMTSPGPAWNAGYSKAARDARLDTVCETLGQALVHVGQHLNPALAQVADLRRRDP